MFGGGDGFLDDGYRVVGFGGGTEAHGFDFEFEGGFGVWPASFFGFEGGGEGGAETFIESR